MNSLNRAGDGIIPYPLPDGPEESIDLRRLPASHAMTQESPDIDEEKAVALHRRFLDKYPNLAQQDSSGQADRILHCRYIVEMDVYLINMRLRMSSKVEDLSFFVSYDGTIKDANEIEERCQKYLEDSLYLLTDALMKRTGESIRELIQGESHNDPVGTIRKLEKCLYTGLPFTPGSTDILLAPTVRHTIFTSQIAAMQKPYGAPIVCRIPHTRWPKNMADNMRYSFTHSLIHYSRQSDPDANFGLNISDVQLFHWEFAKAYPQLLDFSPSRVSVVGCVIPELGAIMICYQDSSGNIEGLFFFSTKDNAPLDALAVEARSREVIVRERLDYIVDLIGENVHRAHLLSLIKEVAYRDPGELFLLQEAMDEQGCYTLLSPEGEYICQFEREPMRRPMRTQALYHIQDTTCEVIDALHASEISALAPGMARGLIRTVLSHLSDTSSFMIEHPANSIFRILPLPGVFSILIHTGDTTFNEFFVDAHGYPLDESSVIDILLDTLADSLGREIDAISGQCDPKSTDFYKEILTRESQTDGPQIRKILIDSRVFGGSMRWSDKKQCIIVESSKGHAYIPDQDKEIDMLMDDDISDRERAIRHFKKVQRESPETIDLLLRLRGSKGSLKINRSGNITLIKGKLAPNVYLLKN